MVLEKHRTDIKTRFFQAIDALVEGGESMRSICAETQIERRNMSHHRKAYGSVPAHWLSALSSHYHISAEWLLLGVGKMAQ